MYVYRNIRSHFGSSLIGPQRRGGCAPAWAGRLAHKAPVSEQGPRQVKRAGIVGREGVSSRAGSCLLSQKPLTVWRAITRCLMVRIRREAGLGSAVRSVMPRVGSTVH